MKAIRQSSLWQGLDPYNWIKFSRFLVSSWERCVLCLMPVREQPLCGGCAQDLPWRTQGLVRRAFRGVDVYAAFDYEFPVSALIWGLKFDGNVGAGVLLGRLMGEVPFAGRFTGFTVTAVPLSTGRKCSRSYNQSAVLACALATRLALPLDLECLRRVRGSRPQRGLGVRQRKANVRAAFVAHPGVKGRCLLLVDDVVTTGATMLACRQALLAAGASEVVLFACAGVS